MIFYVEKYKPIKFNKVTVECIQGRSIRNRRKLFVINWQFQFFIAMFFKISVNIFFKRHDFVFFSRYEYN